MKATRIHTHVVRVLPSLHFHCSHSPCSCSRRLSLVEGQCGSRCWTWSSILDPISVSYSYDTCCWWSSTYRKWRQTVHAYRLTIPDMLGMDRKEKGVPNSGHSYPSPYLPSACLVTLLSLRSIRVLLVSQHSSFFHAYSWKSYWSSKKNAAWNI